MAECKNCLSTKVVKSGKIRGEQRYKCKECGYHFIVGDRRTSEKIVALKAMAVAIYSIAKGSYSMLGHLFNRDRSLIYRWIKEAGLKLDDLEIDGEIREIEFDEMWHFLESKKTNFGLSKRLTVAHGELSPGFSAVVMLGHSDDFMIK